jgi:hypothetical protein
MLLQYGCAVPLSYLIAALDVVTMFSCDFNILTSGVIDSVGWQWICVKIIKNNITGWLVKTWNLNIKD